MGHGFGKQVALTEGVPKKGLYLERPQTLEPRFG
jgi:hypothetical protein